MSKSGTPPEWAIELHLAQEALGRGASDEALPYFEKAVAGSMRAQNLEGEMTACAGLAMALFGLGRPQPAIGPAKRAAELAEQLGQQAEAALFRALVTRLEEDRGEQADSPWFSALTAGQSLLERGDIEGALPELRRAIELAQKAEARGAEATACSLEAQSLLALQRPDEALVPARRAIRLADELGQQDAVDAFRKLEDAALVAIERLAKLEGMLDEAAAATAEAVEAAEAAEAARESGAGAGGGEPSDG